MTIRLVCKCGQQLLTEEAHAGQTVRCPYCNILLRVPNLAPAPQPAAPPSE